MIPPPAGHTTGHSALLSLPFQNARDSAGFGLPFSHVTIVIYFYSSAYSDLPLWEVTWVSEARAGGLFMMAAFQHCWAQRPLPVTLHPRATWSLFFLTQHLISLQLNKGRALFS